MNIVTVIKIYLTVNLLVWYWIGTSKREDGKLVAIFDDALNEPLMAGYTHIWHENPNLTIRWSSKNWEVERSKLIKSMDPKDVTPYTVPADDQSIEAFYNLKLSDYKLLNQLGDGTAAVKPFAKLRTLYEWEQAIDKRLTPEFVKVRTGDPELRFWSTYVGTAETNGVTFSLVLDDKGVTQYRSRQGQPATASKIQEWGPVWTTNGISGMTVQFPDTPEKLECEFSEDASSNVARCNNGQVLKKSTAKTWTEQKELLTKLGVPNAQIQLYDHEELPLLGSVLKP